MDLSIVIVNWNTRNLLATCLRSVYATVGDLRPEVCVVDNSSADGSVAMIREQFPEVHLLENRANVGFARANNQAIVASQGRYVLLLNSDTVVTPGALATLVAFMDAHPQAGAAGPYLMNTDGTLQPSCYPMLTPWRAFWRLLFLDHLVLRSDYPMIHWNAHDPREVEVIKGACFLLRRAALDQVGLLDERYFMYTEEYDLCYRLAKASWILYWVPQAYVIHYGEASARQMAETMYVQLYRSKVQFFRKTRGQGQARLFKVLLALAFIPRFVGTLAGGTLAPAMSLRAHTYRRLLTMLLQM